MKKRFVREHYAWGQTDTYRLDDGSWELHWRGSQGLEIVTSWEALRPLILRDWIPQAGRDVDLYERIEEGLW